jgi:hypothetical protein
MLEPRALRSSSTVQRDPEYVKIGLEYVERDLEKLSEPIPAPECRLLPLPLLRCPLRLSCRDLFLSFVHVLQSFLLLSLLKMLMM